MRVSFASTDDDWSGAARAVWERLPAIRRVLHFERLVFSCIPLLVAAPSRQPLVILLGAAVALIVFVAYPYWLKRTISSRALRQLKGARGGSDWGTIEYSINDRGLTYRDVVGEVTILWWACKGIALHQGDVYVDTLRLTYRIPRRAFGSETEMRALVDFVEDHKGFAGAAAAQAPEG